MPIIKTLPREEVAERFRPQQRVDLGMFEKALEQLDINEWGVIQPDENVTIKLIKRRLNQAARKLGVRVWYSKKDDIPGLIIIKKPARPRAAA